MHLFTHISYCQIYCEISMTNKNCTEYIKSAHAVLKNSRTFSSSQFLHFADFSWQVELPDVPLNFLTNFLCLTRRFHKVCRFVPNIENSLNAYVWLRKGISGPTTWNRNWRVNFQPERQKKGHRRFFLKGQQGFVNTLEGVDDRP